MKARWWTIKEKEILDEARSSNNYKKRFFLQKKLFIFDQDGTTYIDFELLPGVKEILTYLIKRDYHIMFISNNSSRSTSTYRERLSEILGIDISQDQVYTSTLATIQYLRSKGITRIYALGTPDFEQEILIHSIELTEKDPQIIVLAFDTTLTYEKLKKACLLIRGGLDYIATHPDKVCPTREGYIPDTGSLITLIETATGVKPKKVLGKPNPDMIYFLLDRFVFYPEDAIIFGDRLYTDIRMGKESGITTALMLTGESRVGDIEKYGVIPDFVFRNFEEVLELLMEPKD